jgi:bisphosphoglycerate-dependent phosphoglycerate mutase
MCCGRSGAALLSGQASYPRNDSLSKGDIMHQLAKFLTATGRRLRALGKVISHFSRKGKLGLKLAIKIPFFVEIEASFETDWNRRK